MTLGRWKTILSLLAGTFLSGWLSTACGSAAIPAEGLLGAQTDTARIIWTLDLSNGSTLAPRTRLSIFEVQLDTGGAEKRVFISSEGQLIYLGPLQYQLSNAPAQSLGVEVSGSRFLLGWIDESVSGELTSLDLKSNYAIDSAGRKAGKSSLVGRDRIFFIPIDPSEINQWTALTRIRIDTRESLAAEVNSSTLIGGAWEKTFNPPLDLQGLFVPVQ